MLSRILRQSCGTFGSSLKSGFSGKSVSSLCKGVSKPSLLERRWFCSETTRFEKLFEELNLNIDYTSKIKPELKHLEKLGNKKDEEALMDFGQGLGLSIFQSSKLRELVLDSFPPTHQEPQDWQSKVLFWTDSEKKFESSYELMDDVNEAGVITLCPGVGNTRREDFCSHLLTKAWDLSISKRSYSNVISGIAGIGKTTLMKEVGKRIPGLYNDVCCIYFPCEDITSVFPRVEDLIRYVKPNCSQEKFLVFLDDADSVFYKDDQSAQLLVGGVSSSLHSLDVNVQVLGSSQLLPSLLQRKILSDFAETHSLKGYLRGSPKLNGGKLPVVIPTCPASKEELKAIGGHISKKYNVEFDGELYRICSFYFGGIARHMERFILGENLIKIAGELWSKLDDKTRVVYQKFFEVNGLEGKVKKLEDIEKYMFETDIYDIKPMSSLFPSEDIHHLQNSGLVYLSGDGYRPTFPFIMMYQSIYNKDEILDFSNFISTLIPPDLTKSQAISEYEKSKGDGSLMEEVQRLFIKTKYFSDKTQLPGLSQMSLRLHLGNETPSLYYGVVSIDLLNFGAINKNISYDEADVMLNEFSEKYLEISQNVKSKFELCAPYHRSGDEFAFICCFNDVNDFEELVRKISLVCIDRTYKKENGENVITCYSRCGGVYRQSVKTLTNAFEEAKKVENSVKNSIAKYLGYANEVDMKNRTKAGEDARQIQDFSVLSKCVEV